MLIPVLSVRPNRNGTPTGATKSGVLARTEIGKSTTLSKLEPDANGAKIPVAVTPVLAGASKPKTSADSVLSAKANGAPKGLKPGKKLSRLIEASIRVPGLIA